VAIAAGFAHACARRASGAIVCWGANDVGQYGNGTRRPTPTPVAPIFGIP